MEYNSLNNLNDNDKSALGMTFQGILSSIKHISVTKAIAYLRCIPEQCRMHYKSLKNREARNAHPQKVHPIKPQRGDVYNAYITEGVGSELSGNHLVLIVQNKKGNIYNEKVNVLPIEGNGKYINPNYQVRLSSSDLAYGMLDKDPSRIIIADVMTIDKIRLGKKIGRLTKERLEEVDLLLRIHLEL